MVLPIEKQVCSLDSAKRLKELGCPQESLFYWSWCITDDSSGEPELVDNPQIHFESNSDDYEYASAYTVAELGEMLPQIVKMEGKKYVLVCRRVFNEYWQCSYRNGEFGKHYNENTEAEARAKMLIHLIENKLIEKPKHQTEGER